MRRLLPNYFGMLLVTCALAQITVIPRAAAQSDPSPLSGSVTNNTYSSNYFGFAYPLPAGFSDITESLRRRTHQRDGVYLIFAADRHHDGAPNDLLFILANSKSLYKPLPSLNEFVSKTTALLTGIDDFHIVQESAPFDFPNRKFYRETYTQSDHGTRYITMIATEFDDYFVQWNIYANSQSDVDEVAASVRWATFKGTIVGVIGGIQPGTPESSAGATRVRVSQAVSQALLVKRVQPSYPDTARQTGLQGKVVLNVLVGREGNVENVTVISGHPFLLQSALDAVKMWKYRPYLLAGKPVEIETTVTLEFALPGN